MTTPACVLFDLDGVLAHYDHDTRVRLLAVRSGTTDAAVNAALFDSGLERDADLGRYDAEQQASELSRRLGAPVTLADCVDARAVSMTADDAMLTLAMHVSRRATVAILSNNGWLVRDHLGDNVDGAIAAGLYAHHYRDIGALSALLHDLDLLDPCLLEPDHAAT
ncbi:MAG: hypothetical protein LH470_10415 [Lysobacter sp.]|nr:hypothetical protein [Lysobacter sp.]